MRSEAKDIIWVCCFADDEQMLVRTAARAAAAGLRGRARLLGLRRRGLLSRVRRSVSTTSPSPRVQHKRRRG